MPGFTDIFGGQTLQPSDVSYRAVGLGANVTLVWPPYSVSATDYAAGIMDVTPSGAGFTITMPDATLVSPGTGVLWRNLGAYSFTVADSAGSTIAVIAAGAARLTLLATNATSAGSWGTILFGVGASSPDASQLAGYAVRAIGSTLNFAPVTTTFSANYVVLTSDRGKVFVWTGGTGTLTLPSLASASSLPDFEIEVRNQGTGALTVAPVGGEQIDAGASMVLNTTESCFVHGGPAAWYTVGRGRNPQFNFTKLTKAITGGTVTLSLTEAANVIQVYTGALLSDQIVIVPAAVQVYYIQNSTSGAHTVTFKTAAAGGTSVVVDQGKQAILFCDGVNVINASNSAVTVNSVSLAVGAVGSPSLNFAGDTTTGVYQPSSGQFAISISGVQKFLLTSTGINGTAIGATTPSTGAFTTLSSTGNASLASVNKVNITAPATSSTLTMADGKTLTASNTLTLTGTDASSVAFGAGGTVVYQGVATGSGLTMSTARMLGRTTAGTGAIEEISIGSGLSLAAGSLTATGLGGTVTTVSVTTGNGVSGVVTNPTTTPAIAITLGAITPTSVNGLTITNSTGTLTVTNGKTLAASNTLTLTGTDGSSVAFGAGGTVAYQGAITGSGLTQSTAKLLGRTTAGSGAVEEISVGTGLSMSAGALTCSITQGALVLLATLTPTAAANVDALTTFSATYDNYKIIIDGVKPASDDILKLRAANAGTADGASNYAFGGSTFTSVDLSATANVLATGKGASITVDILNVNDATNVKAVVATGIAHRDATPTYTQVSTQFAYFAANAVSGLRLFWSGGSNFAAVGKVRIYGYQNS